MKKLFHSMLMLFVSALLFYSCTTSEVKSIQPSTTTFKQLTGRTMGTTYSMLFEDVENIASQDQIDLLLLAINQSVSTYIDSSEIALFNSSNGAIALLKATNVDTTKIAINGKLNPNYTLNCFADNLKASQQVYEDSDGLFDPTIMPLVNYWGFGYSAKHAVANADPDTIAEILDAVGFAKLKLTTDTQSLILQKQHPNSQLDFSAIAKGYGVDLCLEYFKSCGISNAFVEIGGEVAAIGHNKHGEPWRVGINTPSEDATLNDFELIVMLDNAALASSGNYRNYYEVDGKKYGHEINPKTGYPQQTNILSASIYSTKGCMLADGYATACMIMEVDKALAMIENLEGFEAVLILDDKKGGFDQVMTSGFRKIVKDISSN